MKTPLENAIIYYDTIYAELRIAEMALNDRLNDIITPYSSYEELEQLTRILPKHYKGTRRIYEKMIQIAELNE